MASGDYAGALQSSKDAGKWTKIGFFVGIGWTILCILWVVFWGGMAFFSARNAVNSGY